MPKPIQQFVQFGPIQLPYSQLFILRRHVFATVNLKPVAPGFLNHKLKGHVLVCSRRPVKRLYDMTEVETVEFWITVQEIAKVMSDLYKVSIQLILRQIAMFPFKMECMQVKLYQVFIAISFLIKARF